MNISINDRERLLEKRQLQPCEWNLPEHAIQEISGLESFTITVAQLDKSSWPAQKKCSNIFISEDFISDDHYRGDEILATVLHEIGHLVFPENLFVSEVSGYLEVLNGNTHDQNEFVADDFVKRSGFGKSLISCLVKLSSDDRFGGNKDFTAKRLFNLQKDA